MPLREALRLMSIDDIQFEVKQREWFKGYEARHYYHLNWADATMCIKACNERIKKMLILHEKEFHEKLSLTSLKGESNAKTKKREV